MVLQERGLKAVKNLFVFFSNVFMLEHNDNNDGPSTMARNSTVVTGTATGRNMCFTSNRLNAVLDDKNIRYELHSSRRDKRIG